MKITHRRKSIRASKDIVLDEYQFVGYRDGYGLYRKGSEWVAQDDARKYEPFKITYEQARGFEPIDKHDTGIQKLQKGLGKKLMSSTQIRASIDKNEVFKLLDESGGYTDYNQKIEDVVDAFGVSPEVAEGYVWDWTSQLDREDDDEYDEDDENDDYIRELPQKYTSEKTAINKNKLPAIFSLVDFKPDTVNIDYGGGPFDNAIEYLASQGVTNLVYDPGNRSAEYNRETIKRVRENGGADTATCSNVLNVIAEPEVRRNVLENIKKLVKPSGTVYITVYEGSGKGDERPTSSGYQRNRKTADYLEEIQEVFPDAKRKGKLIVAHPTGSTNSAINCAADVSMIGEIQNKLEAAVIEFMTSVEIGYSPEEAKDYTVIEVTEYESKWSGPSIKCEVRAELSFNAMMDLLDKLNPVVEKYDKYAYFDMEDSGIATAYIPLDSVEGAVNCSTILSTFGVAVREGPYGYTETVEINVDADMLLADTIEFVDSYPDWLELITENDELYSAHDPRVRFADGNTVYETVCEVIGSELPEDIDPGVYHVTCTIDIEFTVDDYTDDLEDYVVDITSAKVHDITYDYIRPADDVESATNTCNIGANPDMLDLS